MTSQFKPIRRLPNMQDIGPTALAERDAAITMLRGVFDLRGYDRSETPILEQTELYIRKSGGALSSRLYGFSEPSGLDVSLRPEFTSAILRQVANATVNVGQVRLMYDGPVFRYASPEDEDGDKTRQFTQLGAEMIGASDPSADGEIIAMALEGLEALGITGGRVVVGHVGVLVDTLSEFNLSERAKLFLINNIGELKNGEIAAVSSKATALGFITEAVVDNAQAAADRDRIASTIEQVLAEGMGVQFGNNTGVRTPAEIVARLSRKMSQVDNPEDFERALEMLTKLSQISGSAAIALKQGEAVLSSAGVSVELISNLSEVLKSAKIEGVSSDRLSIDFGMARGIAYYTGMLFDIYLNDDQSETLGGGGRYDGLTKALGYDRDVPSLGFAYNLDSVIAAIRPSHDVPQKTAMVSSVSEGSFAAAVAKAKQLRASGKRCAIDFQISNEPSEGQGAK
jgi:histidyl-tRNA synthetase